MLSENVYVNTEIQNKDVSRNIMIDYICSECKMHTVLCHDNIENNIDSDPHDPLDDYIICSSCGGIKNLRSGVRVKELRGREGMLFSDGSFIYTKLGKDVYRLA